MSLSKASFPLSISIGALIWGSLLLLWLPWSPYSITHVHFLLLAAPLWVVPLGWRLLHLPTWVNWVALPAGLMFAISYLGSPGGNTACLTLPWLALCTFLALKKGMDWWMMKEVKGSTLCLLAASLYLPVGALWGLADRWGISPWGYPPTITLLTAVHFHYAGFVLPLMTGLLLRKLNDKRANLVGWGVIAGIPLVAVGISATHFQWSPIVEIIVVTIMTLSSAAVGLLHIYLGWKNESGVKWLWLIAGMALFVGMCLACCYGWRSVFSISFLTIPWMYAVHGTLNAVGFAAPGLLGWWKEEG